MVAILALLTMVTFILADWLNQMLKVRKESRIQLEREQDAHKGLGYEMTVGLGTETPTRG